MTIEDLILDELKDINTKLDSYMERTTMIETQIKPLFDNGQPGWFTQISDRLTNIEHWKIWIAGAASILGTLCGGAITLAFEWFKSH